MRIVNSLVENTGTAGQSKLGGDSESLVATFLRSAESRRTKTGREGFFSSFYPKKERGVHSFKGQDLRPGLLALSRIIHSSRPGKLSGHMLEIPHRLGIKQSLCVFGFRTGKHKCILTLPFRSISWEKGFHRAGLAHKKRDGDSTKYQKPSTNLFGSQELNLVSSF